MLINSFFPVFNTSVGWHELCRAIENVLQIIKIKMVLWQRPNSDWHKLNTNGCSKGNPGSAGGGGIIRNSDGSFILAYMENYGVCSNNIAEANVILQGVKICNMKGLVNVSVEVDSQLIINMINHKVKSSW